MYHLYLYQLRIYPEIWYLYWNWSATSFRCCCPLGCCRHRLKIAASSWWRHQMETFFRVTGHLCGEFTGPRWIPRTKASDAELWCFLWSDLRLNERLSKQLWGWWFETLSHPLWCHRNVKTIFLCMCFCCRNFISGFRFTVGCRLVAASNVGGTFRGLLVHLAQRETRSLYYTLSVLVGWMVWDGSIFRHEKLRIAVI